MPPRRDGVLSSCSRVKSHFVEGPRCTAITLPQPSPTVLASGGSGATGAPEERRKQPRLIKTVLSFYHYSAAETYNQSHAPPAKTPSAVYQNKHVKRKEPFYSLQRTC
ncbi:hypothetical protein EYF80_049640 [Liparis tanakae]|uniref:Uncharacterized protein n=1 Tax=Liparis tanakae TaxID=230148 RepID=A0A4Z2FIV2_9TELE|nr:hypothetical protein EYF80_049640 [Liparis tanakae]